MKLESKLNAIDARLLVLLCLSFTPLAESKSTQVHADIWSDNWFAMYLGDTLIKQDSVSINTERSFNAESFTFEINLPAEIGFVIKDFKQNDTGLEYIGSRKQQMGDGGFIAQFKQASNGSLLLVSDSHWRCLPIHVAPLDKHCEKSSNPDKDCKSSIVPEPNDWKAQGFDDNQWPNAVIFSKSTVRPKGGYDRIKWDRSAQFIWTSDIEADNTILCRVTLSSDK
ncbi:PEBP family protein [Vibrio lamellibrachiae]|uniref:PEBP family protein n=1 Tax=Vibrio lamellibrachiae TaxID=2910253 RepID=UPI003D148FC6